MFILYVLDTCVYCKDAINMIKLHNFKHKIYYVKPEDKDKYKKVHKMQTFPQIFYETKKGEIIKIGGNKELKELFEKINYYCH